MDITLADETASMQSFARQEAVKVSPRLRGLVLLAGTVRHSNLSRSIGRSLLDLPVTPEASVLQVWEREAQRFAAAAGIAELEVRVVLNANATEPTRNGAMAPVRVSIERELNEFRGTGGVLRDLAQRYQPDEQLLVAGAAQVLVEPLHSIAADLFEAGGDIALLGHEDGTPGAMFLVNCRILSQLRDVGFLDFKEQVLPRVASDGVSVRVIQRRVGSGFPVRTLDSYLAGLRAYHRIQAGRPASGDPFAEDWSPTFSVVERGAEVDPGATIHDSVVLEGGRVERGAVVVRSIVCPGGVVRAGATVAGGIVASERMMRKAR